MIIRHSMMVAEKTVVRAPRELNEVTHDFRLAEKYYNDSVYSKTDFWRFLDVEYANSSFLFELV